MSDISDVSDAIYNTLVADTPRNGFLVPLPPGAQGNIRAWTDAIAPSIVGAITSVWTAVGAFLNGWANYGSIWRPASYRKEGKRVALAGMIQGGTMGVAAFTLPVGFRPLFQQMLPCDSGGAYGQVQIHTNGSVEPHVGVNTWVSLDGLSFYTD